MICCCTNHPHTSQWYMYTVVLTNTEYSSTVVSCNIDHFNIHLYPWYSTVGSCRFMDYVYSEGQPLNLLLQIFLILSYCGAFIWFSETNSMTFDSCKWTLNVFSKKKIPPIFFIMTKIFLILKLLQFLKWQWNKLNIIVLDKYILSFLQSTFLMVLILIKYNRKNK